ncbi:MAG: thermonuclease family protein [Candidatus Diapherotrites archaeon]
MRGLNKKVSGLVLLLAAAAILVLMQQNGVLLGTPAVATGNVVVQDGKIPAQAAAGVPLTTTVSKVIDGDTLVTAGGEHVRLIGINSREKGEECYTEAGEKLAALVLGRNVRLEFGAELRDRYGRLLAHIYGDSNRFINMEMVRSGFAYAYPYKPNTEFAQEFAGAEREAENSHKGCLWQN